MRVDSNRLELASTRVPASGPLDYASRMPESASSIDSASTSCCDPPFGCFCSIICSFVSSLWTWVYSLFRADPLTVLTTKARRCVLEQLDLTHFEEEQPTCRAAVLIKRGDRLLDVHYGQLHRSETSLTDFQNAAIQKVEEVLRHQRLAPDFEFSIQTLVLSPHSSPERSLHQRIDLHHWDETISLATSATLPGQAHFPDIEEGTAMRSIYDCCGWHDEDMSRRVSVAKFLLGFSR